MQRIHGAAQIRSTSSGGAGAQLVHTLINLASDAVAEKRGTLLGPAEVGLGLWLGLGFRRRGRKARHAPGPGLGLGYG